MNNTIPWDLRLAHLGHSHIQLEWMLGRIHFDPVISPQDGDIVVLLWNWPDRLWATAQAIQKGVKIRVVACRKALVWLRQFGSFESHLHTAKLDGIEISVHPYEGVSAFSLRDNLRKVRAVIQKPLAVARRLRKKADLPDFAPHIAHLRFPSGAQFLHLNLSLHKATSASWKNDIMNRYEQVDWLLVGCDHEHHDGLIEHLKAFQAKKILLTDLIGDARREIGLPSHWLTPLVDQALEQELEVYVFAPHASYRFDGASLMEPSPTEID